MTLNRRNILSLIRTALREDAAARDVTSRAVIPPSARIRAKIIAKAAGILAGGPVAVWTFQAVDRSLRCTLKRRDGAHVTKGQTILTVEGRARSIFAAERTALNLLGHLSGIATFTQEFVRRTRGTRAKIFDTRKTLPGLRLLEKYAVRVGGGQNHRVGLSDAILIKTNHLRLLARGTGNGKRETGKSAMKMVVQKAIRQTKQHHPGRPVEVEVRTIPEFREALAAKPAIIMLDNWVISSVKTAVRLRSSVSHAPFPMPLLEVSGGVTLANIRAIAKTGVDRISIGRVTHSAPSLDMSLEVA